MMTIIMVHDIYEKSRSLSSIHTCVRWSPLRSPTPPLRRRQGKLAQAVSVSVSQRLGNNLAMTFVAFLSRFVCTFFIHWDTGKPGTRNNWSLGHLDTRSLGNGILGQQVGLGCPPTLNRVVIFFMFQSILNMFGIRTFFAKKY